MLHAEHVSFGYDPQAPVLRDVSIEIPSDGLVGILGPNGSGKTTLLRLLAGTRHPQRGSVTLDGQPLAAFSRAALARRMAVVPQETHLAFDYTAGEVAMMGRYPHLGTFQVEGPRDIGIVDEALAATGTLALKARSFATLSGGEKQRVVIAAALAQIFRLKAEATHHAPGGTRLQADETSRGFRLQAEETSRGFRLQAEGTPAARSPGDSRGFRLQAEETTAARNPGDSRGFRLQAEERTSRAAEERTSGVLLLDEPTASLDLGYQLEVVSLLARLHAERRLAVVISTHDLNLAASLCRSLILLRDGQVLAMGPTADVLTTGNIRRLYDVDADVIEHASGHRVVVGLRRV